MSNVCDNIKLKEQIKNSMFMQKYICLNFCVNIMSFNYFKKNWHEECFLIFNIMLFSQLKWGKNRVIQVLWEENRIFFFHCKGRVSRH